MAHRKLTLSIPVSATDASGMSVFEEVHILRLVDEKEIKELSAAYCICDAVSGTLNKYKLGGFIISDATSANDYTTNIVTKTYEQIEEYLLDFASTTEGLGTGTYSDV